MATDATYAGRDIFVDGAYGEAALAALIAEAFALPPSAAPTDASTMTEREEAWGGSGWVRVAVLEPESECRFYVDIVLYRSTLDTGIFRTLAVRHGLTFAWDVDNNAEHDWHQHIAHPDGSSTIRWFKFDESEDSYAVRSEPPMQADNRS